MRPVLHSDMVAAARALLAVPAVQRGSLCARLVRDADWADRYVRRFGRLHPLWGNGTLMGAAGRLRQVPEPTLDSSEYCSCLEMVLAQLTRRRITP